MSFTPRLLTLLQLSLDYLTESDGPTAISEVAGAIDVSEHEAEQLLEKLVDDGCAESNRNASAYLRTYWATIEAKIQNEQTHGIYDASRGNEFVDPMMSLDPDFWKPKLPRRKARRSKPLTSTPHRTAEADRKPATTPAGAASGRRFRVALSFPGEQREFVRAVADTLAKELGQESVLYDNYFEHEFARPDLDTYLQRLYHEESELIAVFLCADYMKKDWCGLEWRAIKDLIKRRDMSTIMPIRFDQTEVPGLFSTDGYVHIGSRPPDVIADLILKRLGVAVDQSQPEARPEAAPNAEVGLSLDAAVFSKEGNIYWAHDGEVRQLTFAGLDDKPLLMRDGRHVVFVRDEEFLGNEGKLFRKTIVRVGIRDMHEKLIVRQKPFKDGISGTTDIMCIDQPTLSLDGRYLYFTSEYAAVSNGLMRVDLETGEWTCITAAEHFELLSIAPFLGYFMLTYTDVRGSGRTVYYKLIDAEGNMVKEFANRNTATQFLDHVRVQSA